MIRIASGEEREHCNILNYKIPSVVLPLRSLTHRPLVFYILITEVYSDVEFNEITE